MAMKPTHSTVPSTRSRRLAELAWIRGTAGNVSPLLMLHRYPRLDSSPFQVLNGHEIGGLD
jgi:hypothetical protein